MRKSKQKRWQVWVVTRRGTKILFSDRLTKRKARTTASNTKWHFSDVVSAFIRYEGTL